MRVLGIDPGSTVTGYGVVEDRRGTLVLVDAGHVRTRSDTPIASRLARIHAGVLAVLDALRPDEVAIEAIFRHKSSESALRLGQARGVALLACGQRGHEPVEYNPSTVKSAVGASGRADKDAVGRMVRLLLGLRELPGGPADVHDAIAIAITHHRYARHRAMARTA